MLDERVAEANSFNKHITMNMIAGAIIVVGAGLFTMYRERRTNIGKERNGGEG